MGRVALAVLLFLSLPARAEVTVTVTGERVSLRAVAAPLNEVLDQLARRTGMKVAYEGGQPRQPVTLTLESRTPAEAVMAVLEGQGINFGLRTDPSGARVERLLVAGGGGGPAAPTAGPGKPTPAGAPPPVPEPEPDDESDFKEEAPDEAAAPPVPQPQPPAQTPPGLPAPRAPTYFNSPFAPQPPPQIVAPPAPPAPTVPEDEEQP